ncbi:MAG: Gfo/Idh/MocA family oxidoreductase [Candidatus Eisenbacteria bacterium]
MVAAPRLGLVGVGALGARHARTLAGLAALPDAPLSLAGLFDLDPGRAGAAARAAGTIAFASADALYDACDGVLVVVPTVAHRAVAERALAQGCHVFVEKPIAESLASADALIARATAAGRGLWVGHSERFNPAVRAAAPYLRAPRYIEARRLAGFSPRATDVDVVLDLMIHDIDLALAITGEQPVRIEAIGVAVLTESEDLANARLEFPSGAVASLTASRVSPDKLRKIRVFAEHAYFTLDCLAGTAESLFVDKGALAKAAQVYALHAAHAAGAAPAPGAPAPDWTALLDRRALAAPPGLPLTLEIEAFARAIGGGGSDKPGGAVGALPLARGEDGRAALAVAEAVKDAMRNRAAGWSPAATGGA